MAIMKEALAAIKGGCKPIKHDNNDFELSDVLKSVDLGRRESAPLQYNNGEERKPQPAEQR